MPEGYEIPQWFALNGHDIPTEEDLDAFPPVYFTEDITWNPTIVNDEYEEAMSESDDDPLTYLSKVNDYGELTGDIDCVIDVLLLEVHSART
jgi:hypothetical protein